jgi:hypothetical protein
MMLGAEEEVKGKTRMMGERRGREEDGVNGARRCSVVSRDMLVHSLARLGIVATSCSRRCVRLLSQW